MGKTTIIVLAILGVLGMIGGTMLLTGIGIYNSFTGQERGIVAQYDQNRNNYDNMFKKFQEVAQVPAMYADDLKKVYDSAIQGRYGKDGSKAVFQFIKEQNPTIDKEMYTRLQQVIESGRNSFEADQKTLLDKKRVYETDVATFPNLIVAAIAGFPKIDMSKYTIVTSDSTEDAFRTKKAEPIKLR